MCIENELLKSKPTETVASVRFRYRKRLSSGGYTSVEDVFRHALEAQDAEESWTDEERRVLATDIEEGFSQAERGDLIDGAQARREIQVMKDRWHEERTSKPRS